MPTRCSRSPSPAQSPSAKRIKLANGQAGMATTTNTASAPTTDVLIPVNDEAYPAPDAAVLKMVEEEMAKPIEILKTYERELDYENKLVLAPMVRTGSLPMVCRILAHRFSISDTQSQRLLSLHYGAGLVWGPEIVDKAIIGAERIVDPETGVISYTKKGGDGKPIFTCHPVEKPFLIYQIGTSDPELAVQAAKTVEQDVAGFDLNCGCPKPFSVHSGMGAALLSTPDLLLSILRALLSSTSLPVSCKIRLLPTQEPTLHLASRILRTGIRALTVHCRTRDMRSSVKALWERLGDIVQLGKRRGVPVICNGDGEGWANWNAIREKTGATSVMIARAAESNPSIFSPTGPISTMEKLIPTSFLPLCAYLNNHYSNTKFLLYQYKPSPVPISNLSKAERKNFSDGIARAKTTEQAVDFFGMTMPDAKQVGGQFLKDLKRTLKEREPDAYGADEYDEDWARAAKAAVPVVATAIASEQRTTTIPPHPTISDTKNIFEQRKEAEAEGNVRDAPISQEEVRQEVLDEEAMMNGA
ncbi:hypothetical protein NliqN6_3035 [Naganishia liquefaciens]|uniref:DUS-like FMN-binding domain-containing protein n=1 Tax=Naganishia liquefaciens TaxID=104408 RepID=A0A8H3YEV4_9TREE|nr:hypothetical protein NliqN6_3035 [Naganishia liquefaciens]